MEEMDWGVFLCDRKYGEVDWLHYIFLGSIMDEYHIFVI